MGTDPAFQLGKEIDAVAEASRRRFDPGVRAVVVAVAVLVLLLAMALPFANGAQGWAVLTGRDAVDGAAGVIPRVFLCLALLFGVIGSLSALAIRRYGAAWVTSLGCDLSVVAGGLAVWSTQTGPTKEPGPGPGAGMILALVAMAVLALLWAGITWGRRPDDPGAPLVDHPDEGPTGR